MQGRGLGLLNTTPGRLPRLDAAAEGSTPTTILGVFPLPFWVLRVEATTPNTRTGYRNVFYKRSIRTRVRSFAFLMMLSFPKQTSEPCTIAVVGVGENTERRITLPVTVRTPADVGRLTPRDAANDGYLCA